MEAVVAMALLALSMAILIGFGFVGLRAAEKAKESARAAEMALITDEAIRKLVGRIRVPYWQRDFSVQEDSKKVTIAWLDGFADSFISIEPDEGRIKTTEGNSVPVYFGRNLSRVSIVPHIDGDRPVGIDVAYEIGGTSFLTVATFGSSPLQVLSK